MSILTSALQSTGFPVTWDNPEDARLFWTLDRMHWSDPAPMLIMDFAPESGIPAAATEYDLPLRFLNRRINTYCYSHIGPPPLPPEDLAAKGHQAEEKLKVAVARLGERWRNEWLPEIQGHLAAWDAFDLSGADPSALAAHLDESAARMLRLWRVHFVIAIPMLVAMSLFDEFYRELLGGETTFDSYKLVGGLENKTVESGRALWKLSRQALQNPAVRRVFEEKGAAEVIPALRESAEGRAFLADFDAYLKVYGTRGDKFLTLVETSWIEDPTAPIKTLKDFVAQPDRDLDAEFAAQVAERERAVAEARAKLASYPRPVVEQFEFLLGAAQVATILSEDHGYWIDYSSAYRFRKVFLEVGRRLAAAGSLEAAEDVIQLSFEEIRQAIRALPEADLLALVAEREAEIERFRQVVPPPFLGTMPSGPPPEDPVNRALLKFFGGPPRPASEPGVLAGSAGSPGVVRGTAKVIRSLGEAGKLQPGDVLVAETTAPPWTPLFASAAAVVTDAGGILSHCAVVAREYGIPAVVGVGMATAVIRDGQTIEVDGNAGVVRLDLA